MKIEVLQVFGSWHQENDLGITNQEVLIPTSGDIKKI